MPIFLFMEIADDHFEKVLQTEGWDVLAENAMALLLGQEGAWLVAYGFILIAFTTLFVGYPYFSVGMLYPVSRRQRIQLSIHFIRHHTTQMVLSTAFWIGVVLLLSASRASLPSLNNGLPPILTTLAGAALILPLCHYLGARYASLWKIGCARNTSLGNVFTYAILMILLAIAGGTLGIVALRGTWNWPWYAQILHIGLLHLSCWWLGLRVIHQHLMKKDYPVG